MQPDDWKEIPGMSREAYALLEARAHRPAEWDRLTIRERQTYVIRTSQDPWLTAKATASAMGLSPQTIERSWKSIRGKMTLPTIDREPRSKGDVLPSGRVAVQTLLPPIEQAALLISRELGDRGKIKKAQLRDLGQTLSKLVEVRALLSGEPTQIVAHEQRSTLQEVSGWLLEELKRRGVEVKVDQRSNEMRIERNVTPAAGSVR